MQDGTDLRIIVLGIMQDGGLPHLGCSKPCCTEARRSGRIETQACLGVVHAPSGQTLLIDATPAIESQVAMLRECSGSSKTKNPVDAIALTHAHMGHYTGLMHLGREGAQASNLPVLCTQAMATFLGANQPWANLIASGTLDLQPFADDAAPLPDMRLTQVQVRHRNEFADTVAYRLQGAHQTVLFCPDIDQWDDTLESMLDGVDVAFLDGTFYDDDELEGRSMQDIPHPRMVHTMDRLQSLAAERPGRIRFIHFNHTNPVLHDQSLQQTIEARGFALARTGDVLSI
jgi:pyrroloquinoline quinone biosynthesis protein B